MPTKLPPSGNFFGSLVTQADHTELAKFRTRLQEILAQSDEHDPRRALARLKQVHAEHAAKPTQESFTAASELSKKTGNFTPEEVQKWQQMITAAKRQAWADFAANVKPRLLAILTRAKEACECESEAQAKRETEWPEELRSYVAWTAYYNQPFATASGAPAFLRHCAELLGEDIKRLQGCSFNGGVFPREFTEFLQCGSVNVMGSLGVFGDGPKTIHDVAPRAARGFK